MTRAALLLLGLSALLPGCTSGGDYPSLAIRDGERMSGSAAAAAPAPPLARVALSTETVTRIAQLEVLGRANHAEFTDLAARASRLVAAARGTAITAKANASAQIALAELQSAHEATLSVLAELDILLAEATLDGAQLAAIEAARADIAALVTEERATIAQLDRALPTG